ncbi:MAG: RNA 2',3'-cyclic phosphodiesterase [Planctomycetales bacterium]|nr:RNA 2',3'-cyclic phosphodiesterase [Planctomycetales bacterium]
MSERMFIAIWADEVADRIHQLQERLRRAGGDVRWVSPDQLHLTLKFLGETTLLQSASVCRAMARVASRHEAFEVEVIGAGAFPDAERPRTLWAGVGGGGDQVTQLHLDLDDALADLHYPRESRFTPHVTVGRVRSQRNREGICEQLEKDVRFEVGTVGVEEICLVTSRLEPEGPIYEVIGRVPLGGE